MSCQAYGSAAGIGHFRALPRPEALWFGAFWRLGRRLLHLATAALSGALLTRRLPSSMVAIIVTARAQVNAKPKVSEPVSQLRAARARRAPPPAMT
ncbi:MAG: hypothetical protein H0U97_17250 [Gammaproteobacteria bacterium]|nr:hypothetical protein [Gammaproteobacteria bacterium]